MRALLLTLLALVAAPAAAKSVGQRLYEDKCLYCHSGNATEKKRQSVADWKKLVARMRSKAPLLIGPRDAQLIVRYLAVERKLVPEPTRVAVHRPPPTLPPNLPPTVPTPAPEPAPPPAVEEEAEPPPPEPVDPLDREAEERGPKLLEEKCSKCHTVRRGYMKIDSRALGDAIIERMRRKTGSGISPADAELLHRFLRLRTPDEE